MAFWASFEGVACWSSAMRASADRPSARLIAAWERRGLVRRRRRCGGPSLTTVCSTLLHAWSTLVALPKTTAPLRAHDAPVVRGPAGAVPQRCCGVGVTARRRAVSERTRHRWRPHGGGGRSEQQDCKSRARPLQPRGVSPRRQPHTWFDRISRVRGLPRAHLLLAAALIVATDCCSFRLERQLAACAHLSAPPAATRCSTSDVTAALRPA